MTASEVKYSESGEALEILLVTARVTRKELRMLPAQIRFDLNLTDAHELAIREIVLDTIYRIADAGDEQIAQLLALNRREIETAISEHEERMKCNTEAFFEELNASTSAILRGEQ
jgi:hypothetical protein